jgi:DNA-binding NarL/FixJ family response regulator
LLISDLNMPKMDGLQVLMLVRRKFPQLRTAVLTSVADEQFRARGYAMGIDLLG